MWFHPTGSAALWVMHCRLGGVVLVCGAAAMACTGSSVSQELVSPTAVKCQTNIAGMPVTLNASGGQVAVRVVTSPECLWSAAADVAWLRVDPPSGQGEAPLTLHVSENQLPSTRTGVIDVNGVQLTLAQAAADSGRRPKSPEPPSVEFSGRVSGLTGACPVLAFAVDGFRIDTDRDTKFDNGRCDQLRDGREIEVKGSLRTTGTIYATKIELKGR